MLPIRILLIDDHAMFRSGLNMLLRSSIENMQVLEAGSLDEVLHREMETPDVLLLDIMLHGLNGLEGIALLKRKWPQLPIIMLSSDAAPETVRQALERGASAFVSKSEPADNMLALIKQVLNKTPFAAATPAQTGSDGPAQPRLTPRQAEVLDLLCQGLPNKTIGRRLGLSENTVRVHVQAVLGFLKVSNRSEAAYAARRLGLAD